MRLLECGQPITLGSRSQNTKVKSPEVEDSAGVFVELALSQLELFGPEFDSDR